MNGCQESRFSISISNIKAAIRLSAAGSNSNSIQLLTLALYYKAKIWKDSLLLRFFPNKRLFAAYLRLSWGLQGPRSNFLSGGLNWTKFFLGGGGGKDAWEFLLNFSKVTENAFITIKSY